MRVIRYFKTFFLERQYFYNNELFQCFFYISSIPLRWN